MLSAIADYNETATCKLVSDIQSTTVNCTQQSRTTWIVNDARFSLQDFGYRGTKGETNLCFYRSALATKHIPSAVALKAELAPLATAIALSRDRYVDYGALGVMAEDEVILAFAKLKHPVCVVQANSVPPRAVFYSMNTPLSACAHFLVHKGKHYKRLIPEVCIPERILNDRMNSSGVKELLIKWKGFSDEHNSWEPATSFQKDLLRYEAIKSLSPRNAELTLDDLSQTTTLRETYITDGSRILFRDSVLGTCDYGDTVDEPTNLSFFLALKNGTAGEALVLRAQLAGPSLSLDAVMKSNDLELLYRAYARVCGPITVLQNGTATTYFDPSSDTSVSTPVLLREGTLFSRLLPDPREEVSIVDQPCHREGKEMFHVNDNLLCPCIHSDKSFEMACTGNRDAASKFALKLQSFSKDFYTIRGASEYLYCAHAMLIGPLCVVGVRDNEPYAKVYSQASRSAPAVKFILATDSPWRAHNTVPCYQS